MHILVAGAAGFLGSNLCDYLINKGHSVVGVDNLSTGNSDNIAHLIGNEKFKFIKHDVANYIAVQQRVNAVMHFASPASPNPDSPYSYVNLPIQTMVAGSYGTFNTLEVALKYNARYLFASTSEIYGDPLEHPQKETYYGHVDSIGLRSVYDEAKRFSEALVMAYHRKFNVDTRIVRIFNTYGPRMRIDDGRVVPNFIMQALKGEPLTIHGDGSQTRSFCYVDDLIDGIYKLLMSNETMPVNIGNPSEMSILEFAILINQLTGNTAGIVFMPDARVGSDPQMRRPDISKAKEVLHWEPKVDASEGLLKTIEYFKTIYLHTP